jgi:hypothetical protein
MPEEQGPALIAGPYEPPKVRRGDWIECEVNGLTRVGGYSCGQIPWPRAWRTGTHQLIVTAELARAVRTEAEIVIAYWWDVGLTTVWAWRRALGVGRMTDGTVQLYRELQPARLPPEAAARGLLKAAEPEVLARMAVSKRGVPVHPNTRSALIAAAQRPKSADHRHRIGEANHRRAAERKGENA